MTNERGFYCVTTQDRIDQLFKFLKSFSRYNNYPVYVAFANDKLDAYRKKTQVGFLSPFKTTVLIDTDIYVNGELTHLFEIAESGSIGIYHETTFNCFNSGVVAFPEAVLKDISPTWLPLYEQKIHNAIEKNKRLSKYRRSYRENPGFQELTFCAYDQDILNNIIGKYPISKLPREYNCILKEITPQYEAEHWKDIKIFHFLHGNPDNRNLFKCFKLYHGIENAE